jgi:cysteine desulfurase
VPDCIYLDHAAISPLHPRVAEAMLPWIGERFGNPSAQNRFGREAEAAIEGARAVVAQALNCRPSEIVFTSGGSESINAALKGVAYAQQFARLGSHLVVSAIEHHAVLHTAQYLEKFGCEVDQVGVDTLARIDPDEVAGAIRSDTALVSLMLANNEVGTVEPIEEIVRAVAERGQQVGREIPVHVDAVQAPLWLSVDVARLGVQALSLSAHKFGGPTGAGVLYLRRGVPFLAQQTGGGQERQRRAGTENVPAIVGTGAAIVQAEVNRAEAVRTVEALRQRLVSGIRLRLPDARLNGDTAHRLPNIVNFSFPGIEGERLVADLDEHGIAVSSGSACMSSAWEPSHVLLAMGVTMEQAVGALRFSLGPETTAEEIDVVLERLPLAIDATRSLPVG